MLWLAIALASTASPASGSSPLCRDAPGLIKTLAEEDTRPLGMTLSFASDYGVGKLLRFRTSHFLGYPGLPFREGTADVTYYTFLGHRVCELPLDATNCPELKAAEDGLRAKSYPISAAQELIPNGAYHNPSILFQATDGAGSTVRIRSHRPDHPASQNVSAAFSMIARCTREADREIYESN